MNRIWLMYLNFVEELNRVGNDYCIWEIGGY